MSFMRYWGKAQPIEEDASITWHPLAFHCLDVAAVGEALFRAHPSSLRHMASLLSLPPELALPFFCRLIALHDIGKFAMRFQAKVAALYTANFGMDPSKIPSAYDHGYGGLMLFDLDRDALALPNIDESDFWRPLISAVTGHHGAPPKPSDEQSLRPIYHPAGVEAAKAFATELAALFPLPDLPAMAAPADTSAQIGISAASFALAGLTIQSDWIGSNQIWFPYRDAAGFESLADYWAHARDQAGRAIRAAGILPAKPRMGLSYDTLIEPGCTPTPMQAWTQSVPLPAGPSLFMIEDETGSGKTEAALMLAHRLIADGRADGLYLALPTMASANQMFGRLGEALRHLFTDDAPPSLNLVHGARDLFKGFRVATLDAGRREPGYGADLEKPGESDDTASTACAAWIADDRRRSFLADAGAGTIDQAILAVLPSRHQALRLFGLMRRVLVLDEVHAYDAYVQREIEALLEFQAHLGGSAILLSATLPGEIRQNLANAFTKGLGPHHAPPAAETAAKTFVPDTHHPYPLATVAAREVRCEQPVAGKPGRARRLPVRFLRDPEEALDHLAAAARDGKAALYIRNTVDNAMDAHAKLTARGVSPLLFHARFALADRMTIETQIVETFGKRSIAERRAGQILVATQVVEQSLDLDFDVMVSDLAPIDLLIQRAGRLWRHDRSDRTGKPELLVVSPPVHSDADENWFPRLFRGAAYVYGDHARLWLTAKTLENVGAIDSPGGLRALIEAVYGPEADKAVPEGLLEKFFTADGDKRADRSVANTNVLAILDGYVRQGGAWDDDMRTPTRLGEKRETIRLARMGETGLEPYALAAAPDEPWRAWRLSEIDVSANRVLGEALAPEHRAAAAEAKAGWTKFDMKKPLVVLAPGPDGCLHGTVQGKDGPTRLTYGLERGLEIEDKITTID